MAYIYMDIEKVTKMSQTLEISSKVLELLKVNTLSEVDINNLTENQLPQLIGIIGEIKVLQQILFEELDGSQRSLAQLSKDLRKNIDMFMEGEA